MDDRFLSPSEVAQRFGLSIKALRHYESCGLLAPKRTSNGSTGSAWRVYGPDQVARLHQILALKRLGLTLARIGEILAGPDKLVAVLALQEQALTRQGEQLARALALVRAAQAKLKSGHALSIDDLATLNQETVMPMKTSPQEMKEIFTPFIDRHMTAEEKAELGRRKFSQADVSAQWDGLMQEARVLMANGDDSSPKALDLARRWRALTEEFTRGDPGLTARTKAIWNDVMADPEAAKRLGDQVQLFTFVNRIMAGMDGQKA